MVRVTTVQQLMMRVYLESLGCRLNEAELASWGRALSRSGGTLVTAPQLAEVMVLNTCAVTAEAVRKSRKLTNRLHRSNPRAKLVLTGCMASLQPREVEKLAGVDLIVPNTDKDDLVERLQGLHQEVCAGTPSSVNAASDRPLRRTRAFVKIQDGCRNRCSFCIVTVLRGEERSRPIQAIVDEVNALHRSGFQEVVLTGVHLGGYGSDLGVDLAQLIQALLEQTQVPRLRLSSLEPWDLPAPFWSLWQDTRLCPHLHLPLQSGSNAVLRRMARRTDTASYLMLAEQARSAIPDLVLTTDIIVGFPGETETAFAESLDICAQVGFAHVHIFSYSPRDGTAAARMAQQVDPSVKRARSARLLELARDMRRTQQLRFVGSERSVLWEGQASTVSDGLKCWSGLTDNYLRVESWMPEDIELNGQITRARITGVTTRGSLTAMVV